MNQLADGTYIGGEGCELPSSPDKMYKVNTFALFFANDGSGHAGLWRSDGTKNGTYFISDLDSIDFSASVSEAYSTGSLLYFVKYLQVYDSSTGKTYGSPKELWRSDGTTAGTFPVFSGADKRIDENFWNNNPEYEVKGATIGSNFFFVASQQIGDTVYSNIYKTNGTVAGTTPYFQIYKARGTIETPFITGTLKIISFNNQLYFNYPNEETGWEIWAGDGINPPHLYCDFNPGPLGTVVGEWINLNDQYLILSASIYTSVSKWTNKILRIKSNDACPVVIDENAGNSDNGYNPSFHSSSSNDYCITDNKFFFENYSGTGSRLLEATNGEINGTFSVPFDYLVLNGVHTKGLIFTEGLIDTKTYTWNGNSPTSYDIFSDSLNATEANGYFSPNRVIQLDTAVFIAGSSGNNNIVWQTNVNGSYCYRVSTLNLYFKGVNLGDTAYLALGDAFPSGTFPCGTEPVLLKKFDKVWTGKISSDWNNNSNWLPSGVPKFTESVVIPRTQYNPVINGQASCKDLFLNNENSYLNNQGITVNKSANLDVHGYYFSLRGSDINGEGSLTRKGTFVNTTYGDGAYNIDSININGADWDLTSMNFSEPN
ncbi:MAG TPA: hypothetical protein VK796_03075, partial [Cytophaga sp.]|nr:hypothetical protein [Cytophaga sp.]